jgi:hypothetical protein
MFRSMRAGFALPLLALACLAGAQERASLFSTVRADVTVVVSEHSTSADMVEITMLNPEYPADLLKKQAEAIGQYLGTGVRFSEPVGPIQLSDGTKFTFIKAKFATDGLIDRKAGVLRLEPILKAFAGAPEPYTVNGFAITFDAELPQATTVREFNIPGVLEAEGRVSTAPAGIEYRVRLLNQDPSRIKFPERLDPQTGRPEGETADAPDRRGLIIGLFVVAGVAVAALVYLALLRPGSSRGRKR